MLVFIGKLLLSTLRWVPICQGFSYFSRSLHHFVLAKLATSSIRVKPDEDWTGDDYRNFKILITKIIRLFLRCCLDDWVNKPGIQLQSKMNLPWWILRPTIDFFVAPTDSGKKWIQKRLIFHYEQIVIKTYDCHIERHGREITKLVIVISFDRTFISIH